MDLTTLNTEIISPPKATSQSPIICLEPLEVKSCGADDISDGVQSMDVRLAPTKSCHVILEKIGQLTTLIKILPVHVINQNTCHCSPVSRDELIPEYSPVSEISPNSMTSVGLGDIHVLTEQVSHPKVSAASVFGDCNKNLIQDCSSATIDSSHFQSLRPTSDKLNI